MEEYITIASYTTTIEALRNKKKLDLRGIEAFISDNPPNLEPITQNKNDNVHLNIRKADFDIASKVIGMEV